MNLQVRPSMKLSNIASGLLAILLSLPLSGCINSSATVTGKKLTAGPITPQRLLVFADVGIVLAEKLNGDEEPIMAAEVKGSLLQCGIVSDYMHKTPIASGALTLGDSATKSDRGLSTSVFGADTVLDIQWLRQTTSTRAPASASYSLTLIDMKSHQPTWTAQMQFVSAWYGGQRFAAAVIDALKQDGIIPSTCPTPLVPKA